MRVAIASASASCWVVRRTAPPSAANDARSFSSERRAFASMPAVGSSRKSAPGFPASASATASRLRWPPERPPAWRPATLARSSRSRMSSEEAACAESARERARRSRAHEGPVGSRRPGGPPRRSARARGSRGIATVELDAAGVRSTQSQHDRDSRRLSGAVRRRAARRSPLAAARGRPSRAPSPSGRTWSRPRGGPRGGESVAMCSCIGLGPMDGDTDATRRGIGRA